MSKTHWNRREHNGRREVCRLPHDHLSADCQWEVLNGLRVPAWFTFAETSSIGGHIEAEFPRPTSPVAPELTERCVVCGGPKNRDNIAGEERVLGWPYCVNPKCEAFQEPVASASWLPSPSERRRAELYAAYEEAAGDPAFSVHEADSVQPMPNSSTPSEQKPPEIPSPSVAPPEQDLDAMLDELNRATNRVAQWRWEDTGIPSLYVLQEEKRAARESICEYVTQLEAKVVEWTGTAADYCQQAHENQARANMLSLELDALRSPSTGKELK